MAGIYKQHRPFSKSTKAVLKHGAVLKESIYRKRDRSKVILSWRVMNFSELRLYVLYYQLFEDTNVKCVFKLFKTKKVLYACLRSRMIKNNAVQFCIVDEEGCVQLNAPTKQLTEGLYVGDFMNELFLDSDSKYLKNDILTMSFSFNDAMKITLWNTSPQKFNMAAGRNEFCNDLKHMYLASLYSDFTIRVDDDAFLVHKFVLASRSKFFEAFLSQYEAEQEYWLEAVPRIVHEMLLYVYSGELKKLDMPSMLEMYDLARKLRIDNLTDICLSFIAERISENTCSAICSLAERLDSTDLRNIVNTFKARIYYYSLR